VKYFNYLLIILLAFLFWLWRYHMVKLPDLQEGMVVRIRGVLREEPSKSEGQSQSFSLRGIQIKARRFPGFHYGDCLIITGKLGVRVISKFSKQFRLIYPDIHKVDVCQKKPFFHGIFGLKRRIEAIFNNVLPEPQASLLSGIVLGSKREIESSFYQALKKTGTLHVVVASGANISLVSQPLVENLAGFLSRRVALVFAFIFTWLYAIISGFEPPVVRAAIMANIGFLAQFMGKEKDAFRSLVLAGMIMVFLDPLVIFDLGFQLSFSATAGILLLYSKIRPYFKKLSFIGDDLSTTLAAQVFVLPIIYFNFKQISVVSPLVNALVLWTIEPLMELGGLIASLGLFSQPLAQLIAYPAWLLLTIFVKIVELFK
jgi:competence protein ComEC